MPLTKAVMRVRLYQRSHRHSLVPHVNVRLGSAASRSGSGWPEPRDRSSRCGARARPGRGAARSRRPETPPAAAGAGPSQAMCSGRLGHPRAPYRTGGARPGCLTLCERRPRHEASAGAAGTPRPRTARRWRPRVPARTRAASMPVIAAAKESMSSSRASRPVSPSSTVSSAPPAAAAITGLPAAWASTAVMPNSSMLGTTTARAPAYSRRARRRWRAPGTRPRDRPRGARPAPARCRRR